MRILFDIGHPAHVHFFRETIRQLKNAGHETAIVTKDKEIAIDLLNHAGFEYSNLGKPGRGLLGKATGLLYFDYRVYQIARKFRPDLFVGLGSPYFGHVAALMRKPYITFWDTEEAPLISYLTYPFCSVICTPSCFLKDLGSRQVRYNGYKELAYLHPDRFTPDPSVLDELGLGRDEKFIIIRFISWSASHDIGLAGIRDRRKFVRALQDHARVLISSESEPDPDLEQFRLRIAPEKFHSLLAFADLYIGEGGTVATEAAVLGTPAIHIESIARGVASGNYCGNFKELRDRYNLLSFYPDEDNALRKAIEILDNPRSKTACETRRAILLKEKTDVSSWMVSFIENYPDSLPEHTATGA